jgi:hypothetical protein
MILKRWKKNSSLTVAFNRYYDNVPNAFDLGDSIQIAADEYVNKDITIQVETPSVNFLNAVFDLTAGTFYGGDRFSAGMRILSIQSYFLCRQTDLRGPRSQAENIHFPKCSLECECIYSNQFAEQSDRREFQASL